MFQRQKSGAVLCPSCGRLVGVSEKQCPYCGRRNPGMWGLTSWFTRIGRDFGFADVITAGCVLVYVLTLVVDTNGIQTNGMFNFLGPSADSLLRFGASGALPIRDLGRWWTLLSAGWLHAGLLHIGFNLYGVRMLAPVIAELYGQSRMVIIYTAACITGFALSTASSWLPAVVPLSWLGHGYFTIGASAPLMGLVGALVYYGRRGGSRLASSQGWTYAIGTLVFGLSMPGIDNWAHIGGFAGGYLVARLLDPLKPERTNHVAAAFVCLLLSAAAIVVSLVVPLPAP
jgi:rhomboid protease GluP